MRRGLTPTVVVAAVTAVVALALLVWGSSNGAPLVGTPQGSWDAPGVTMPVEPPVETAVETGAPQEGAELEEGIDVNQRLVDFIQLAIILTVLYGMLVLLRGLVDRGRDHRPDLPSPQEDELVALLEASSDEVRYRALTEGDPRNAIVACWVALEEAVHHSGLREDRSRTAAELTTSVLSRWQVDPAAITALSDAYREARFSRHEVSEEQRTAAVDALETIHGDLLKRLRVEQRIDLPPTDPAADDQAAVDPAADDQAASGSSRHQGGSS